MPLATHIFAWWLFSLRRPSLSIISLFAAPVNWARRRPTNFISRNTVAQMGEPVHPLTLMITAQLSE